MSKDPRIKLDWRNPFPHPGTWQQFCIREDNEKLNLNERKQKFLKEESLYYKFRGPDPYSNWLGGGGSAGGNSFAGNASDGPLSGATVTSNIGAVVTDTLGNFIFPDTPAGEITVTGGTDAITGVAFTGELKGFPQYKTISPMTTLAYHLKEEDASLTADTAVDLLFASSSTLFGIELTVVDKDVMLNKDYVAESIGADSTTAIAAQSIATYLESVTSMVGSAVKGADDSNFTTNNAKVEGYKSIARQIQRTSGAKTEIDPQTLFDVVKLPDGNTWTTTGSLNTDARLNIKTTLTNVRVQLGSLARSEAYSANYLTTQIQAINRGVKEDYAVEADKLAKGQTARFDTVDTMVSKSTGSIAQLESGKSNETTRAEGEKTDIQLYAIGAMTFKQTDKRGTVVAIEGKHVSGSMQVIVANRLILDTKEVVGKYLLKAVSGLTGGGDALTIEGADNYDVRLGDVTATQTTSTQDADGDNAGKVYEFTLSNPSLQIRQVQLIDAPAAGGHIFTTGTYTLSMEDSKVTQVLGINAEPGETTTLSFGSIKGLGIPGGIVVSPDADDSTKFVVAIAKSVVTPRGGTAFSGTGDRSVLLFTYGVNNYTITYTT